jgi:hypothetical protein
MSRLTPRPHIYLLVELGSDFYTTMFSTLDEMLPNELTFRDHDFAYCAGHEL